MFGFALWFWFIVLGVCCCDGLWVFRYGWFAGTLWVWVALGVLVVRVACAAWVCCFTVVRCDGC